MSTTVSDARFAPAKPRVARPLRPGRGAGRQAQPQARPPRPVAAPRLGGSARAVMAGCQVERPTQVVTVLAGAQRGESSGWRLTERGIALVLVTGLAIATAALVVVGMTAMRVTGDSYAPAGQLTSVTR